MEVGIAENLIC